MRFVRTDCRLERYEAVADDGAVLVVWYNPQWEAWFWSVERGKERVSGSAFDIVEAQERAIAAWVAMR